MKKPGNDNLRINRQIRSSTVMVVDDQGNQLGELNTRDAIEAADNKGLDLVEVAPKEKPPVCRMMDYGKFKYKKSKKAHEAKKNQKIVKLKEIKTTPRTSEHDYQFKLKHVLKFLSDSCKVKVTVFFRGRQITHPELGAVMLDRFIEDTKEIATVTQNAKREGRTMNIMLEVDPKKAAALKKAAEAKETVENAEQGEKSAKNEVK